MFSINNKVLCIDDSNQDSTGDKVKRGKIYSIREVEDYYEDIQLIRLVGLCAGQTFDGERGFLSTRFSLIKE